MEQTGATMQVGDNPLNQTGLCILSLGMFKPPYSCLSNLNLDGGGVRGLSTLLIIKALMARVNDERKKDGQPPVKPCELFDLIGGTSTGG
jgi:hypothetical protein